MQLPSTLPGPNPPPKKKIKINGDYFNKLRETLFKENKTIFLLGNFNINLLNDDAHPQANKFPDSL